MGLPDPPVAAPPPPAPPAGTSSGPGGVASHPRPRPNVDRAALTGENVAAGGAGYFAARAIHLREKAVGGAGDYEAMACGA